MLLLKAARALCGKRTNVGRIWNRTDDKNLLAARRRGESFSQIGRRLKTTKGSAQSRYYRLEGIVFASAEVHLEIARRARKQAARERRQASVANRELALRKLKTRMGAGMPQGQAIERARREGLTFAEIGAALGISRQAAQQCAGRWRDGNPGRAARTAAAARSPQSRRASSASEL